MKHIFLIGFLLIAGISIAQQTGTFTDSRDGKIYNNVLIGNQTWMNINLDVSIFRNGDSIPEAKTDEEWIKAGENKQPVWCYYDNDPKNGKEYGKLYNWYAVIDSRGLAPLGWRIPVEADWSFLINYFGGKISSNVKMKSTSGWDLGATSKWFKNTNGSNESGFSGLPGGKRDNLGQFFGIGEYGYWWSSTEFNGSSTGVLRDAYAFDLTYYFEGVADLLPREKKDGYSIRCIKEINEGMSQVSTALINTSTKNLINQETTMIYNGSFPKCFKGDCKNGYGECQYSDGIYSGEWKNGQRNGKGTFTSSNGDTYTGEFLNDNRNGNGKYQWKNGDVYEGDWVNGMNTGNCKWTFSNGVIYEGSVVNGKYNGKGVLIFSNGAIGKGDFVDGVMNGKGKMTWKTGEIYEGDWLNGQRTGKGKYKWINGEVYDGDFVNGEFTGNCKWYLSNGDIYEGDVLGGKYNGKGKYQWKNGEVYEGDWVNGQINQNQVVQLASWNNGSFKELDKKSGNNLNMWTEGNGQLNYEEISRTQTPNGDIEVILNDINGRSGMQVRLTNGVSYWKYSKDQNWIQLYAGAWSVIPSLNSIKPVKIAEPVPTLTNNELKEENCEVVRNKYLEQNQDVKNARIDPWAHYLNYGKKEGRKWPNCTDNNIQGQQPIKNVNTPITTTEKPKTTTTQTQSNNFKSVQIGTQTWMSENLNVDRFRNGDPIPEVKTNEEWMKAGENKQPAWCYYDNDPKNGKKYGKLYNWYAVSDPRGLAPAGWQVSTNEDWINLYSELGGEEITGNKLKKPKVWIECNNDVKNEFGFSALPAGNRGHNDNISGESFSSPGDQYRFFYQSMYAFFWTSQQAEEDRKSVV
jgi:uncharacterized protein (TIGR02145 family)